jgi:hypothetical protein
MQKDLMSSNSRREGDETDELEMGVPNEGMKNQGSVRKKYTLIDDCNRDQKQSVK